MFVQKFRRFCIAAAAVVFTVMMSFGLGSASSWASVLPMSSSSSVYLVSAGRAEAMAKDIEGKAQEAVGNVTGDRRDQITGQAKQLEGQARNAVEDVKDGVDSMSERAKAASDMAEGRVQEAVGNVTGDRQDQIEGQAKQAQGEARNVVEGVKDRVQDLFN